ncbi:MAG: chemotaxis protein CheW, partial [Euryarchaeota archaeon]|nr:chemotaxis protein CheW [Euryarchaeota archaeon]
LGKGSKFELVLPPTMAIVMVMMVQINARRCAIPITHVAEVASLSVFPIQNIGHGEGILMRDEIILLYRLYDMFGDSEHEEIVVVIQSQNKKGAITVDLIEGQQEVVIKPLSKYVGSCAGISGVTIPGDGEVVPVLDVNEILAEHRR